MKIITSPASAIDIILTVIIVIDFKIKCFKINVIALSEYIIYWVRAP